MFVVCLGLGGVLGILVFFIGFFLSKSVEVEKEKGGAYECGFESFVMARVPFSLQFFLIGVIFLIFDVEIVLMMPFPLAFFVGLEGFALLVLFVLVLIFGVYFEWGEGSLDWVK